MKEKKFISINFETEHSNNWNYFLKKVIQTLNKKYNLKEIFVSNLNDFKFKFHLRINEANIFQYNAVFLKENFLSKLKTGDIGFYSNSNYFSTIENKMNKNLYEKILNNFNKKEGEFLLIGENVVLEHSKESFINEYFIPDNLKHTLSDKIYTTHSFITFDFRKQNFGTNLWELNEKTLKDKQLIVNFINIDWLNHLQKKYNIKHFFSNKEEGINLFNVFL